MEDIIFLMAEAAGFNWDDIMGRSRLTKVSVARQVIWWKLRNFGMSYMAISRIFGRRHCAVVYGVGRINDLMSIRDKLTVRLVAQIEQV